MFNNYSIVQPTNQSESFMSLVRDSVVQFFNNSPVPIQAYMFGNYTLEGLSNYYKELESKNYTIGVPHIFCTLNESPTLSEDINNVNLHTVRLLPSLLVKTDLGYFLNSTPYNPMIIATSNVKISRIDQYVRTSISINVMCDSYEMAYDIIRYCQSMLQTDKTVTFRNLVYLACFAVEDITTYPQAVIDDIYSISVYTISEVSKRQLFSVPFLTWVHVKVTDYALNIENIPYDSSRPVYQITTNWQLFYPEPAAYIIVY
jgi:hypothetical protein